MNANPDIPIPVADAIERLAQVASGVSEILLCMANGMPEIESTERDALTLLGNNLHQAVCDLIEAEGATYLGKEEAE